MRLFHLSLISTSILLFCIGERIKGQGMGNPPPPDSLCMVFSGVDYGGFPVYYSKIVPEYGIYDTPREIVSKDNNDGIFGGIFLHITYYTPASGPSPGHGITWCWLLGAVQPADCYYKHMPPIPTSPGVEEEKVMAKLALPFLEVSPNPFTTFTTITFTLPGAQAHNPSTALRTRSTREGYRVKNL